MINILVLGAGGREHALAWKLKQSPQARNVYVAPGNAGTATDCVNVNIEANDFHEIKRFVLEEDIDLVLVGPEDPLAKGITDFFQEDPLLGHVHIFGPGKKGARLESSKDFAKSFMLKHNIPTAEYQSFTSTEIDSARDFIRKMKPPYVLKADGLAAGKGVLIMDDEAEALRELEAMFSGKFGTAGNTVVIEEFLQGIELSVFVVTDGESYVMLPEAKDYKRIGEGDTGLNTGGMGSISPVPFAGRDLMAKIEDRIVKPTVSGLKMDNIPYCGFIFFGLMNVEGEPYVIEYNVRMGDPEAESVIPRIQSDFAGLILNACEGNLKKAHIEISTETAASVMLVSGGYPGSYEKGKEIKLPNNSSGSILFHAGTSHDEDNKTTKTSGGRVIAVTSLSNSLQNALAQSYATAGKIDFEGKYFRSDIGRDLMG